MTESLNPSPPYYAPPDTQKVCKPKAVDYGNQNSRIVILSIADILFVIIYVDTLFISESLQTLKKQY